MAKVTVTITFTILFSLFLISHARIPSSQPLNLITENKPSTTSSESDTNTVSVNDLTTPSLDLDALTRIGVSLPTLTTDDISSRPINRHFHHMHKMNRPFLIRLHRAHNCRYHNGKNMVGPREAVSYGNDMIVTSERKGGVYDRMDRSRDRYFVKPFHVKDGEMLTRKNFENMKHVRSDAYMGMKREEEVGIWNKVMRFVHRF